MAQNVMQVCGLFIMRLVCGWDVENFLFLRYSNVVFRGLRI